MRHFNITYTSHFNRRHKRVGHLYQGRYKSFLVEKDSYLSMVSRYIHLNPVTVAGLKKMPVGKQLHFLGNYQLSSLPGFVDLESRQDFVEYTTVLAKYGVDTHAARLRYKKQLTKDLATGVAIKEQIV